MDNETNIYISSFNKNQRLSIIVFLQIMAEGFEETPNNYKAFNIIKQQASYLGIEMVEVVKFISNINIDSFKNSFFEYNSYQKDLLVGLSIELITFNGRNVSEINYSIAENCFEKIVNINRKELSERIETAMAIYNSLIDNKTSKKELSQKEKQAIQLKKLQKENPDLIKAHLGSLMKDNKNNKNCYIATLAYGDINHPKVEEFRKMRDNSLSKNIIGRKFIEVYYKYSPSLVVKLKPYKKINACIRNVLDLILKLNK